MASVVEKMMAEGGGEPAGELYFDLANLHCTGIILMTLADT